MISYKQVYAAKAVPFVKAASMQIAAFRSDVTLLKKWPGSTFRS